MSIKSIPLEPHFYIVKLGVYMGVPIFHIFAPKHRLCVLVRTASARRSEREPTINVFFFSIENFQLLQFKIICIKHGHVFVMLDKGCLKLTMIVGI